MSFRRHAIKAVQKVGWIYLSDLFFVTPADPLADVNTTTACEFAAITAENANRSRDFREEDVTDEFREKHSHGETGFFALVYGKAAGNIWATINATTKPVTARGFMKLMPGEALIHDIVTGPEFRGMGIGPFMVTRIIPTLFDKFGVRRIVIDVNVKNAPSLRMMNKAGLRAKQKTLSVSAFHSLVYHKTLETYAGNR